MRVIIRADASPRIGTGHVMRCLALSQACVDRGLSTTFLTGQGPMSIVERLHEEGCQSLRLSEEVGTEADAEATIRCAFDAGGSWIVVDGYHFDAEYQRRLKESGLKVLWIDDHGHAGQYCADLVLNQNLHANEGLYASRSPSTRLLLGTRFVLLRREILAWQDWKRTISPKAKRLLVTMGGSDSKNATLWVLRAIQTMRMTDLSVRVVLGPAYLKSEPVREQAQRMSGDVQILDAPHEMGTSMAWADVAVSAAGSTCWELAFMGLPSLVLTLAPNQEDISTALENVGVVVGLGNFPDTTADRLTDTLEKLMASRETRGIMSSRGRGLVDGSGTSRVVNELLTAEDAQVLN